MRETRAVHAAIGTGAADAERELAPGEERRRRRTLRHAPARPPGAALTAASAPAIPTGSAIATAPGTRLIDSSGAPRSCSKARLTIAAPTTRATVAGHERALDEPRRRTVEQDRDGGPAARAAASRSPAAPTHAAAAATRPRHDQAEVPGRGAPGAATSSRATVATPDTVGRCGAIPCQLKARREDCPAGERPRAIDSVPPTRAGLSRYPRAPITATRG